ncbi:transcription termination factor Rho [Candidatus Woesebacteria bacterium RIFOXYB1_FULL_42_36]|uniref:Transcription termination factor Rho n=1 Tax=Candidatus Woesebacteria bacterium RIFOXYD1_FULL_43_18 TaxID=1802551 RepID=A0A1F8DGG8_9BACT|nr:MAG: transcription termination factor Rho [Candidatus Woesebacteria bacterium RIFOXYA1_FULL_43_16]OGM82187.1 MAG: transcription termination factor Rho [Candidatus Woesebacteria bacterium RIFOXYB1_FULL_42_36]OGM84579.1 MAG: transcription termination factor Rho [Candidatus Woesebacteria bacterium RIFOXYC1_FULL_43_18]OGM87701.1 MAG: transcription termination factor Rho [Candidatus Woesebacteria bacterium RIFOXYD1_FULL_43_18]
MPKKAVEKTLIKEEGDSDVQSLVGAPVDAGMLPPAPVAIQERPINPLVVDERMIPDAGLPTESVEGVLDIANEGSGLLRPQRFAPSDHDIYISASQIRRFNLRVGDMVGGQARRPKENERYWGLLKVEKVNGEPVEALGQRVDFDDMTAVYPDAQIILSTDKDTLTNRMIDLVAPIGFGQRALIVSPPKAGKTWLVKDIIKGIALNYPEKGKGKARKVHIMAVLIGERPEEVTDIIRTMDIVTDKMGEVAASNFDEAPQDQTRVGELALERARRLVEGGRDVVIVLDSITRMARAYNLALPTSGRTLSGGFDPMALFPAKKFFGAARKIEGKGSLTIIGTCLVDTGSRMDDLIYEEFKGTGNMELHLDRKLSDKRVFPAIDISRSGTRQDELLFGMEKLKKVNTLRRMIEMMNDDEKTLTLIDRLSRTETNDEFLDSLKTA